MNQSETQPPSPSLATVHETSLAADGWLGRYVAVADQRQVLDATVADTYLAWVKERQDPGRWDGEHIGKWLEAAALVWRRGRSPQLLAQMDAVADQLIALQDADGYLGSYREDLRFHKIDWNAQPIGMAARFDLWCHLMILNGLLDHHEAAGRPSSLASAAKAADLVLRTFGDGRQDIMRVMHNRGQGPLTAILPMARLYGLTGDQRYADFCGYCIRQFGRPHTLPIRMVDDPAAAAADVLVYEPDRQEDDGVKKCELELTMRGLLELYRHTGEKRLLATSSAVFNRLYQPILPTLAVCGYLLGPEITDPVIHHNPLVETCDIPPALRWWGEAFRQTGEARFLAALERSLYNQLLAHHRPEGGHIGFDARAPADRQGGTMRKQWRDDACNWRENCCLSMGALGLCWIPSAVAYAASDEVVIALYAAGTTTCRLGAAEVRITQETTYPVGGEVRLRLGLPRPLAFRLRLRIPEWAEGATVAIPGEAPARAVPGTLHAIARTWRPGDTLTLSLPMRIRCTPLPGPEKMTLVERGPLILAAPLRLNDGIGPESLRLPTRKGVSCTVQTPAAGDPAPTVFTLAVAGEGQASPRLRLTALSDAGVGGEGDPYRAVFPMAADF
ncbi:MAG: beta-L-arabinofuranosidase domain-containing protein [Lentisphaeria bacterium]|jgi:hypothetical protein